MVLFRKLLSEVTQFVKTSVLPSLRAVLRNEYILGCICVPRVLVSIPTYSYSHRDCVGTR